MQDVSRCLSAKKTLNGWMTTVDSQLKDHRALLARIDKVVGGNTAAPAEVTESLRELKTKVAQYNTTISTITHLIGDEHVSYWTHEPWRFRYELPRYLTGCGPSISAVDRQAALDGEDDIPDFGLKGCKGILNEFEQALRSAGGV